MGIPYLGFNGEPEFKSRSRKTDRERTSFREFFDRSPKMNPNASLIKCVGCGIHSND